MAMRTRRPRPLPSRMWADAGSARTLLLAALALAAAVMVGSIALVAFKDDGKGSTSGGDAGSPLGRGPGGGHRGAGASGGHASGTRSEDDEDDDDKTVPEYVSRVPDGPDLTWTPEDLRAAMTVKHWEEVCRLIETLQAGGTTIPEDVVRQLLAMLAKDDLRGDAQQALGFVNDEATGRLLTDLAASRDASIETRQAALDALRRSGVKSALPGLQALIAAPDTPPEVARHAYLAIGAIESPEATRSLLSELTSRPGDDDLRGVIVTALGNTKNGDTPLAQFGRSARERGDRAGVIAVAQVAMYQGANAGPETRAELTRMVESPETSLAAFKDDEDRLRMQGTAMPAAVAAGIIEPVLRAAQTSGPMRDIALNALRQARGDAAAKQIAAALKTNTDEAQRRELTVALGETASKVATPTLVSLLDDESSNIRHAAARGLSQIRDPAAVKPLLSHLDKASPDSAFGRNLVEALGTIGVNDALPALKKLEESEEDFWVQLRPWIRLAINRITTGNPESQRLDSNIAK